MTKRAFAIIALLVLCACATSPIPENYSGPLATIGDTGIPESGNRSRFFFLSEIDGRPVENGLSVSRRANSGRGFGLTPQSYSRDVPAMQATFTLKGEVEYGAPIQAMLNAGSLYKVEKKVTFAPEPSRRYLVKGALTADKQDVWLEDETGQRIQ